MQYGQGKWYPGEPLPRWKLACFWRKDGVPMWNNDTLMADLSKDYKLTHRKSKSFINNLVKQLSVDPENITPLYEDSFYFIWQEGKVPVNINPAKYNLKSSLERQKLAKLLKKGLGKPVGYSVTSELKCMKI